MNLLREFPTTVWLEKYLKMTEYAMYKGEAFIDLGTISYLADKYHKTKSHLKFLTSPAAHRRDNGNMLLLYKIIDDKDCKK